MARYVFIATARTSVIDGTTIVVSPRAATTSMVEVVEVRSPYPCSINAVGTTLVAIVVSSATVTSFIRRNGASHSPDLRVFTITPASQKLLESTGAWNLIANDHTAVFKDMQAWDAMGDGFIRFDAKKMDKEVLGHVVEHRVLVRALHDRMNQLAADSDDSAPLKLYCPAKVKHFQRPTAVSGISQIGLEDGQRLKADLVVAADGGNSIIRSLSALGTWGWDYDQQAVVATVKTDRVNETAWQRFFPTGPVALLPMRDGYSSVVWSCTADMAKELTALTPDEFVARLNDAYSAPPMSPVPPEFPGIPVLSDW
ncbi:FAD/NAD(P)-binding domain [Phytophthora cactorum]|nr:FAD/NAD(P)-binding domain [Phytophthora cactorum]